MQTNRLTHLELSHPERRAETAGPDGEPDAPAPAAATAAEHDRLRQLACEIRRHQESLVPVPSDTAFVRQYPALGSTTSYQKLRDGKETRDPATWIPRYLSVLGMLRLGQLAVRAEPIYEDLAPARVVHEAIARLSATAGKDRLVVVSGPSGSGKTESLRLEAARHGGACVIVDADETWRSARVALGDILSALGETDIRQGLAGRRDQLIAHLAAGPRLICIDEGHHAGVAVLNLVKTLINRTPARFVIAAQSTLWKKLTSIATEEAMQLFHNRLHTRVALLPPDPEETADFLARRLGFAKPLPVRIVSDTARAAASCGHYAFLRRVAEHLTAEHAAPGISAADMAERVTAATNAARLEIAA